MKKLCEDNLCKHQPMSTEMLLCEQAVDIFGRSHQTVKVIEELAELIKEITRYLHETDNIENLSEEIADVEIMLTQLKIIAKNKKLVQEYKDFKISRLQRILEKNTVKRKLL